MIKTKSKNIKIKDSASNIIPCTMCNPKRYIKFSFAYVSYESGTPKNQDIVKLWERMRWMSEEPYDDMVFKHGRNKDKWFEKLPISSIRKNIPEKFREEFYSETNEEYSVMRVFPAGTPNGTANPRIIGMIKHSVFYVFFLDWDGKLYNH